MKLDITIRCLNNTMLLAAVLAYLLIFVVPDYFPVLLFVILWSLLFFSWPPLSRRMGFPNFPKPPVPANAPPVPKRPPSVRTIRGTLRSVATTALALLLLLSLAFGPVSLSFYRARTAHDAVHIGMTVPEVLHAVTNCELFRATSEFPHDDNADAANIPAMNFGRMKNGVYQLYDMTVGQNIQLSESEVIERLRAKLHDGYRWHFYYTYTNIVSADVYFSVVFGPDGRVTEVEPVRGLD